MEVAAAAARETVGWTRLLTVDEGRRSKITDVFLSAACTEPVTSFGSHFCNKLTL